MSRVCGASYADTAVFALDNKAVLAGIRSLVRSRLIPFTFFGAVQRSIESRYSAWRHSLASSVQHRAITQTIGINFLKALLQSAFQMDAGADPPLSAPFLDSQ